MRIEIRRTGGNARVALNVRRENYTGRRGFIYMAALSDYQLKKIERACGSQPSQWTLSAEYALCLGCFDELGMQIYEYPNTWALCWGKEE